MFLPQQVPLRHGRDPGHQHIDLGPRVLAGQQRPEHGPEVVADIGDAGAVDALQSLERVERGPEFGDLLARLGDVRVGRDANLVEPVRLGPHGVDQEGRDPPLGQGDSVSLELGVVGGLGIAQPMDEQHRRMEALAGPFDQLSRDGSAAVFAKVDFAGVDPGSDMPDGRRGRSADE